MVFTTSFAESGSLSKHPDMSCWCFLFISDYVFGTGDFNLIRPTLEKCVVVGQLLDTRSLGGQLLVCGPLGLLDFVFRAFGRSGRVTHAYVSMMHVSMMHVSMIHVSLMHVSMIL